MAVVAAAITVERLAPAGERVARATGAVAVGTGLFLIAQAAGLGRRIPRGVTRLGPSASTCEGKPSRGGDSRLRIPSRIPNQLLRARLQKPDIVA